MDDTDRARFNARAQQKTEVSLSFDGGRSWTIIATTEHAAHVDVRPFADPEIARMTKGIAR